jgi:hypothetical protein
MKKSLVLLPILLLLSCAGEKRPSKKQQIEERQKEIRAEMKAYEDEVKRIEKNDTAFKVNEDSVIDAILSMGRTYDKLKKELDSLELVRKAY